MSAPIEFSIILPVLNEAGAGGVASLAENTWSLAGALKSLKSTPSERLEVIVADGGSTDSTRDMAAELADFVLVAPRGRGSQMNAGAAQAQGKVLLFLHADTRLPDNALAEIRAAIAGGACWGRFDVAIVDASGQCPPGLGKVARMMNWRSRWTGIATGDQAIFVTRAAFAEVGGFADIPLMEDIDFSRRMKRLGPPACLRAQVQTSARRWQKHGVWPTILLMWWLRLRYFFGADPADLARAYGYVPRAVESVATLAPCGLAVLAKAPIAGVAKTRLIPRLGMVGAAALQAWLLRRTLNTAVAAGMGPVQLWCAPDQTHAAFRAGLKQHGNDALVLYRQPETDLGGRMLAAFAAALTPAAARRGMILVGTDCPALTPEILRAAAEALAHDDAVFVPVEDGGYALIGLRTAEAAVFADIDWGSSAVMAQTRDRMTALGWRWHELPLLWDVDRPEDFDRCSRAFPELADYVAAPNRGHA